MISIEKVKESLAELRQPLTSLESCDVLDLMDSCIKFVEQLLDPTPIDEFFWAAKVRCDGVEIDPYVNVPGQWEVTIYDVDVLAEDGLPKTIGGAVTTRGQVRALFLAAGRECGA